VFCELFVCHFLYSFEQFCQQLYFSYDFSLLFSDFSVFLFGFFTERNKKSIATQEKKVVDKSAATPSSNSTTQPTTSNNYQQDSQSHSKNSSGHRQVSPEMRKVQAQMKHQSQFNQKPFNSLPPQLQKLLEHKKFEGKIPNLKRPHTPTQPNPVLQQAEKLTPSQISVGDSSIRAMAQTSPQLAWPTPKPAEPKAPIAIARPPVQSTVNLELEDIEPSIIFKPGSEYFEV
jgi:hypothetical protein